MKRSITALVVTATLVGGSWSVATAASADESKSPGGSGGNGNCLVVISTPAADHLPGQGYTAMKNHC